MSRHGKGGGVRTYNAAALQEQLDGGEEGAEGGPRLGAALGGGSGPLAGAAMCAHASRHAALSKSPGGSGWTLPSSPAGKARGLLSKVRERQTLQQKHVEIQERARKELECRMEEKARKRDWEFDEMFGLVIEGIAKEKDIMKDVDETLRVSETARAKKKAALYESWKREVYDKISSQIDDAVNSLDPHDVKRHLQTQYEAFLSASNHKAGIFRDIVIETDYDPFAHTAPAWSRSTCRASRTCEAGPAEVSGGAEVADEEGGPEVGQGGQGRPVEVEDGGAGARHPARDSAGGHGLEGVPKAVRLKPRGVQSLRGVRAERRGGSGAPGGPQGEGVPGPPGMEGKRKDLFSLMSMVDSLKSHAELLADGQTQGDTWLEHKGKGYAEKPKNPMGRKDLFAVISHEATYSKETQVDEMGARQGRRTFADKVKGQISLTHGESSGAAPARAPPPTPPAAQEDSK